MFFSVIHIFLYTDLPAGKIANVATCLEIRRPPARGSAPRSDLQLQRVHPVPLDWYRDLFRRIGEDWMWFSRLALPVEELRAVLDDPHTAIWKVVKDGIDTGLIELDMRSMPDIELAFFGIVPDAVGGGIGRWMMDEALSLAFAHAPARVWVHTCTLDHPSALPFYLSCGFVAYKRTIEVADDPRLTGALPRSATPQLPIL